MNNFPSIPGLPAGVPGASAPAYPAQPAAAPYQPPPPPPAAPNAGYQPPPAPQQAYTPTQAPAAPQPQYAPAAPQYAQPPAAPPQAPQYATPPGQPVYGQTQQWQQPAAPAQYPQQPAWGATAPQISLAGVNMPGDRLPEFPDGEHVCDIVKTRLSRDQRGVIADFVVVGGNAAAPGSNYSIYLPIYGYQSSALDGLIVQLVLSTFGFSKIEQADQNVINVLAALTKGDERILSGRRIIVRSRTAKRGPKSAKAGEPVRKATFAPFIPTPPLGA